MKILIIDASVLAYKSFMRLFERDYEGETNDEIHECTRQYVRELVYLTELHRPDGVLFAMDCPRDEIWRHRVVRRFYGPRLFAYPTAWYPGTENPNANNACRWYVECHDSYKEVWIAADGSLKSKKLLKKKYTEWAKEKAEAGEELTPVTNLELAKRILPQAAKMYKGTRSGQHWPSNAMPKESFRELTRNLAYKLAPLFNGRVVGADELEADDIAYAAVTRWRQHDITVATVDQDWLTLSIFQSREQVANRKYRDVECGTFKFWDMNKYEFRDASRSRSNRVLVEKILTGDASDNIASARLLGQTSGIGPKKADKIMDEVPMEKMFGWLKENGDMDTLIKNAALMNLSHTPEDLKQRADQALADSNDQLGIEPDYVLEDFASEATIHSARVDGQMAHQKHIVLGGKDDDE